MLFCDILDGSITVMFAFTVAQPDSYVREFWHRQEYNAHREKGRKAKREFQLQNRSSGSRVTTPLSTGPSCKTPNGCAYVDLQLAVHLERIAADGREPPASPSRRLISISASSDAVVSSRNAKPIFAECNGMKTTPPL